MRVIGSLFIVFFYSFINAQSYVDSGIQKYQVGEFDEAIAQLNKGYELRDALPSSSVARIFFYRGLSKFEIFKKKGENSEEGITLQEIYADIDNSLKYENVWPSKLEEIKEGLFEVVIKYAEDSKKLANKEKDFLQKTALLAGRIEYLKIAGKIQPSSRITLLLAETHKEIGDVYFESTQDLSKLQIAKTNYEEALKLYEVARYDDPFSKDIIKALLELSKRLLDQERIEEYQKLLDLAGG